MEELIRQENWCFMCLETTEHVLTFKRVFFMTITKTQKVKYEDKCLRCNFTKIDTMLAETWMALQGRSNPN